MTAYLCTIPGDSVRGAWIEANDAEAAAVRHAAKSVTLVPWIGARGVEVSVLVEVRQQHVEDAQTYSVTLDLRASARLVP